MKRVASVWAVCLVLSLASFAVLLLEDRRLDVPVPYSVPLAFTVILALAAALSVLAARLLSRAPDVIRGGPVRAERAIVREGRVAMAYGTVLLDLSTMPAAAGERAA